MTRFFMLLLTTLLIFSCSACSAVQSPPMEDFEKESNVDIVAGNANEEVDEAKLAQQAYNLIENAESICKNGMGIISAGWYFGIWDAPECENDTVIERLSSKIGFDISFIEENGGYTADELINGNGNFDGWELCLMTAENCLSAIGAYTSVDEALVAARVLIREIPDDYVNYQYLKDYFTKVAAYAEYFENISGSYNDLTEAVTEYENRIRTAKEPLLFDFG